LEENRLIQLARQGDQNAWIALVETHQQALFRLAYLSLGDPDDAKDVAQEAFIRAYQNLERFKDGYPLRPWLLRITSNLARNRKRSLGRYWTALTRLRRNQGAKPQQPLEKLTAQRREAETLWQALKKLRKADQEVIYLRYFLDLSVKETAQVLEVSPGTVKSRLHRSLKRLRAVINTEFPALKEEYT
jgi:RNA polymerase sigma-70 factor (ECF subfamily)